ncbi:MAG TPA: hypothetical protein DHV36_08520 [Desulfobacteraceae bacterium]|nr:hypothetical protein [Desulfobacteraceae bacterium]
MELSDHIEKIEEQFWAYETLQNNHLALMREDRLSDVAALVKERKDASANLQKALNAFVENAGSLGGRSIELLSTYENRLNDIMALDEQIASEIEKHRGWLKKELSQMKHGKKAIQGYQSAGHPPKNRPRVFSVSR